MIQQLHTLLHSHNDELQKTYYIFNSTQQFPDQYPPHHSPLPLPLPPLPPPPSEKNSNRKRILAPNTFLRHISHFR